MASINIQCPSCESGFAIKDTLVGKKVDCPKCKYRFKAESADDDDDAPRSKKDKKGAKKGSNALVIGGVIGALALILLVVGGIMLFGGGGKDSANKSGGSGGGGGTTTTGSGSRGGASDTGTAGGGGEGSTTPEGGTSTPKPATPSAGELKDPTNLLPGEAISVYVVNADRVAQTPLYNHVFDSNVREFFRNSLTFDVSDVQTYIHCVVNPDRMPFGVFRLKKPLDQNAVLNKIDNVKATNSPIRGRHYNTIKSNGLLDAIGRALSSEAIRGEAGLPVTAEDKKKWGENRPLAFHIYDDYTLIIAEQLELERFLNDLGPDGYPPFKTLVTPDAPPPSGDGQPMPGGDGGLGSPDGGAPNPGTPGRGRGGPPGPGGPPGGGPSSGEASFKGQNGRGGVILRTQLKPLPPPGSPSGGGGPPAAGPGGPPAGEGGTPGEAQPRRRSFNSNPHFRTVDEQLKSMLNRLEDEDPANPPAIFYAEMIDQRIINQRELRFLARATNFAELDLISQVKVVGAAIRTFNRDKLIGTIAMEFQHDEDARQATARSLTPILEAVVPIMSLFFGTPIDLRNGGSGGAGGGPGFGGGDTGDPSAGGAPGGPPAGVGRGGPPGRGGGPGGPPPGVGRGPGGPPPDVGGPGGVPGGPGGGENSPSFVNVTVVDKATLVNMEIHWNEQAYNQRINQQLANLAIQLKGRMAVLSGETTWHSLAAAIPKFDKKPFPRGTAERELNAARMGLPHPPEHRVSFMAELLPYLGKGGLRSKIQDKKLPWFAKENLTVAEAWIPEFLVPYYPQTSWRAYHPLAEGRVLGATNFVGLAGLGLESARFDPTNAEQAKKIGITGYNWGSAPADITDGLSNTIYLIQVPPGVRRAWIAGGGATLMGVDDETKNPILDFVHTTPDKRRGTYVLMADGSVRWLTENTDGKVFKSMVTRAGSENLADLDKLAPKVDPPKGTKVEIRGSANSLLPKVTVGGKTVELTVDQDELAKMQGDWAVRFMMVGGVKLTTEQLEQAGMMIKIEGDLIRVENKTDPTKNQSSRIIGLDPKKNPKELTDVSLDGPKKDQKQFTTYEFVGHLKLKMRASIDGKTYPKSVRIPEEGSKDLYVELEKIEK